MNEAGWVLLGIYFMSAMGSLLALLLIDSYRNPPRPKDPIDRLEALCYTFIITAGSRGMIADEISAVVEGWGDRIFPPNQVASRLMTLRDKKLVVRGGVDDVRKTRRGRNARVHYQALRRIT